MVTHFTTPPDVLLLLLGVVVIFGRGFGDGGYRRKAEFVLSDALLPDPCELVHQWSVPAALGPHHPTAAGLFCGVNLKYRLKRSFLDNLLRIIYVLSLYFFFFFQKEPLILQREER